MEFKHFHLHEKIEATLEKEGLITPTKIQLEAIPKVLEGKDLLASAQTGTGKTAAFILPALHLLIEKMESGRNPKVLILTPTRELACQVASVAEKFSSKLNGIKTVAIYGGVPYPKQTRQLNKPFDILVATPGRLIDHIERKKINLGEIEMLVLDEADRMLDMGFIKPVEDIAALCPKSRQTLLFSATMSKSIVKLSEKLLNHPIQVHVAPEKEKHELIDQHFKKVENIDQKYEFLNEILDLPDLYQAIIFTATKRSTDRLAEKLSTEGRDADALHGDMRQRERTRTIKKFRLQKTQILVATDVAARGIDISTVSHVINFDLPMNAEDYVHRIGRTGRAGVRGIAHSFATRKDLPVLKEITKYTGLEIPLFKGEKVIKEKPSIKKRGRNFKARKKLPFQFEKKKKFKKRGK